MSNIYIDASLIKESVNGNYLNLTKNDDDLDENFIDRTHRFWGDDHNLFTRVGKVVGRSMLSTGREGHLIFGPYISLAAGCYRVAIRGKFGINGAAGSRMDVCVEKGTRVLVESSLSLSTEDDYVVSLVISLDIASSDLEVRVLVKAESEVAISLIEIQPLFLRDRRRVFDNGRTIGDLISIGSDKLAVTFQPYEWVGFETKGFGEKFLISRGFDVLCFKPSDNDWYQDISLDEISIHVSNLTKKYKFRLGYGSSMGAYGLLYFAGALNLNKAIVFSPQYSIDRKLSPFETRWEHRSLAINFLHDSMTDIHGIGVTIIYDPCERFDSYHVDLIRRRFPEGQNVTFPFTGHPSVTALHECDMLSKTFDDAYTTGNVDIHGIRNVIRIKSNRYATNLLQRTLQNQSNRSIHAFSLIAKHRFSDHSWVLKQGLELGHEFALRGFIDVACSFAQKIAQVYKNAFAISYENSINTPPPALKVLADEVEDWRAKIYRFRANNIRLSTHAGKLDGLNIVSTGKEGCLIFGPYISLEAGIYSVFIRGSFNLDIACGVHADVAIERGSRILAGINLAAPDEGDCLASLKVVIDTPCTDLEVRVWVKKNSNVSISMLEIQPYNSLES